MPTPMPTPMPTQQRSAPAVPRKAVTKTRAEGDGRTRAPSSLRDIFEEGGNERATSGIRDDCNLSDDVVLADSGACRSALGDGGDHDSGPMPINEQPILEH
jgi:hypothetical protein